MVSTPDINFPEQPDPANLARQQGESNLEAAIATALLNQVSEVTPFGTVSYQQTGGLGQQPQAQQSPISRFRGGDGGAFRGVQPQIFGQPRPVGGAPAGGGISVGGIDIPQFTRTVELTPAAQAQLESQQAVGQNLAQLAQENIGAVRGAQQQGLDFANLPAMVSGVEGSAISEGPQARLREFDPLQGIDTQGLFGLRPDFAQQGQELEQATFERGRSLLEPQFSQQHQQAELRLSERGLPLSSRAGQNILGGLETARGRQLNELALASVGAGRAEQERLANQAARLRQQQFGERAMGAEFANLARGQGFGQALQAGGFANQAQQQAFQQAAQNAAIQNAARGAGFQERAFLRNLPLSDIATLLGTAGQPQLPQFQPTPSVGVQAPDIIGATLGAGQQGLQQAKIQQDARSSLLGGLFDLGGSLGSAAILASDIRVKDNIRRIGKINGFNLYEYQYKGENDNVIGVLAQEVERVNPDAVVIINGIRHVNYDLILEAA